MRPAHWRLPVGAIIERERAHAGIVERERAHAGRDASRCGEGVDLEASSGRLSRSPSWGSSLSRDSMHCPETALYATRWLDV